MKTELNTIAFDHYQRYACSARLIEALGEGISSALEVGANRQRLMAQFLPGVRFVFTDLSPFPGVENGFVQANATALPFADSAFDATVCLDVVEHMPSDVRAVAVAEMVRVSRRTVIIGCPVDKPWAHEAEARANSYWKHLFGTDYPWLEEHQEFGLVDGNQIELALRTGGMRVVRFGHADVGVWSGLMGAHFIKEKLPELQGLVAEADKFYNTSVFLGDRSETCYREFFVGVRGDEDLKRVQGSSLFTTQLDKSGTAILAGLAEALRPVVDRTLRAEAGWSETAECVHGLEALQSQTLQRAEQAEHHASKVAAEWQATVERVGELERALETARSGWTSSVDRVGELEQSLEVARSGWSSSADRVGELERSLETARDGWSSSVDRVGELEQSLKVARDGWQTSVERINRLENKSDELSVSLQAMGRKYHYLKVLLLTAVVAFLAIASWLWLA